MAFLGGVSAMQFRQPIGGMLPNRSPGMMKGALLINFDLLARDFSTTWAQIRGRSSGALGVEPLLEISQKWSLSAGI
jgi:hypothetical protein